jgi:hypothetical protein
MQMKRKACHTEAGHRQQLLDKGGGEQLSDPFVLGIE